MKVYDGANWIAATAAGTTSMTRYRYVATSGQTTFSGADANSATMSYTSNNIVVNRNGSTLDPSEYTATNGTSVVLSVAAGTGDIIDIIAFKSFTVADTVPASTGGTFNGDVKVIGNVGIGTSSPSGRLHVDSSAGSLPLYVNSTASAQNVRVRLNSTDNASSVSYVMSYSHASLNKQASMLLGGTGAIGFYVGQTAGAEPTTGTLAQTIDSSGNVGIGTSSPSSYGRLAVMTPTANYGYFGIANSAGGAGGVNMAQYYGTTKISYIDSTLTNGTPGSETAFLAFATANSGTLAERMRIDSSGNVLVTNVAGLGYGTGSGGTVTQATSKSTAVTLNKPTGQITTNNAALAAGATVSFTVNNSLFTTSDLVLLAVGNGSSYTVIPQFVGSGTFNIRLTNTTAGSLSEAVQINFALIKGASA